MLDFSDKPYKYFEPRYSWFWAPLLRWYGRRIYLKKKKKISQLMIQNKDAALQAKADGAHVLIVGNHPTHADAAILIEACWRVGMRCQFMAAYDVFLRSKIDAWAMQRLGAFSVDRESSDTKAMKAATKILTEGELELTILPEGNVYLENERVTPFHDGAAMLAARAAKNKLDNGGHVVVLPVAIKASYVEDITGKVDALLEKMMQAFDCEAANDDGPLDRLRKVGAAAIIRNMKHRGMETSEYNVAGQTHEKTQAMIEDAANRVLDKLEAKLSLEVKHEVAGMERVRQCRRVIHDVLSDPEKQADHAAARTWADQAMMAMKILSYSGDYVSQKQSIDRIAETAEKLAEDVYGKMWEPFGKRKAVVRFCKPIDVTAMLQKEGNNVKLRQAVYGLTRLIEERVQGGVNEICEFLVTEGMSDWASHKNTHNNATPSQGGHLT